MPSNLVDGREGELVEPRVDIDVMHVPTPDREHHAADRLAMLVDNLGINIEDRRAALRRFALVDEADRGAPALTRSVDLGRFVELASKLGSAGNVVVEPGPHHR